MPRPNPLAGSHRGYHDFIAECGQPYGHFEVFWFASNDTSEDGWYWHACFPGCLPDGDPRGPFLSSRAAHNDARAL